MISKQKQKQTKSGI